MKYLVFIGLLSIVALTQANFEERPININIQAPSNKGQIDAARSQPMIIQDVAAPQQFQGHQENKKLPLNKEDQGHHMRGHQQKRPRRQFDRNGNGLPEHKRSQRSHPSASSYPGDEQFRGDQPNQFDNQFQQDQRDGHKRRHGKKGGLIKHVIFLIILSVISFVLIKKCIKKRRNNQQKDRLTDTQYLNNPNLIYQDLNKHYNEINRLNNLLDQVNRRVSREQPIIYHQVYPQNIELSSRTEGLMINENCMPRNMPSMNPYPQIPMGQPVNPQRGYYNPRQ